MVVNNFTQNSIWKKGNLYSGYLGTIYSVFPAATIPRLWAKEKARPPEINDWVSDRPGIDPNVKTQIIDMIYHLNLGQANGKAGNVEGFVVSGVTDSIADTEFEIEHDYGKVPKYYMIYRQDKAYPIYKGDTAWTKDKVYLKCHSTDMNFTIMLFGEE